MAIEINSNQHKLSNNKLRYYFNDITKFEIIAFHLWNAYFIHILRISNQNIQ